MSPARRKEKRGQQDFEPGAKLLRVMRARGNSGNPPSPCSSRVLPRKLDKVISSYAWDEPDKDNQIEYRS